MVNNAFTILYAEDDEEDRYIFLECMKETKEAITILHAKNGVEVLRYLQKASHVHDLPNAIITDLKMPLVDGLEVLKMVKQEPRWQHIPYILYSTSSMQFDISKAFEMGAEAFFSKPNSYGEVVVTIQQMINHCRDAYQRNALNAAQHFL